MVQSKIKPYITYPNFTDILPDDLYLDTALYQVTILDNTIIIGLGKEKTDYLESDNLYYIPIYLIYDDAIVRPIGIYEIESSKLNQSKDEEGDFNISMFNEPILFPDVSAFYLKQYSILGEKDEDEDDNDDDVIGEEEDEDNNEDTGEDEDKENDEIGEEDDEIGEEDEDETSEEGEEDEEGEEGEENIGEEVSEPVNPEQEKILSLVDSLSEIDYSTQYIAGETQEQDHQIRSNYLTSINEPDNWIAYHYKNKGYQIHRTTEVPILSRASELNDITSNCLFNTIIESFRTIDKSITSDQLREIVASQVTPELFNAYLNIYKDFTERSIQLYKKLKELKKQHDELTNYINMNEYELDKERFTTEYAKAKQLEEDFEKHRELYEGIEVIRSKYAFMNKVETIDDFKMAVKSCAFWANEWAINILESMLNIKFIILSRESCMDKENTRNCEIVECQSYKRSFVWNQEIAFRPKYYIIIEKSPAERENGLHKGKSVYQLVSYKNKKIMTYEELPYGVRNDIVKICVSTGYNVFSLIPRFQKWIQERSIHIMESRATKLYTQQLNKDEAEHESKNANKTNDELAEQIKQKWNKTFQNNGENKSKLNILDEENVNNNIGEKSGNDTINLDIQEVDNIDTVLEGENKVNLTNNDADANADAKKEDNQLSIRNIASSVLPDSLFKNTNKATELGEKDSEMFERKSQLNDLEKGTAELNKQMEDIEQVQVQENSGENEPSKKSILNDQNRIYSMFEPDQLKNQVNILTSSAKMGVDNIENTLKDSVNNVQNQIQSGIDNVTSQARDSVNELQNNMKNQLSSVGRNIFSLGQSSPGENTKMSVSGEKLPQATETEEEKEPNPSIEEQPNQKLVQMGGGKRIPIKIHSSTSGLFDPRVVFLYYDNSPLYVLPGKANGEKIYDEYLKDYERLIAWSCKNSYHKPWRRMLSNLYKHPMKIDGKKWLSVEHYYQAQKFSSRPEIVHQFSLDSKSKLSKSPRMARDVGETGKYKGKRIIKYKPDKQFYTKYGIEAMKKAFEVKFSNPVFKQVLKATNRAKLMRYIPGRKPVVAYELMKLRSTL